MKNLARVALALSVLMFSLPLVASEEATFDRTLKVTGPVDLEVVTGSGNITIRSGAAGSLTVHGTVKAGCCSFFGGDDPASAVKAIAANPPIEQSGNVVRIGHLGETQRHNNISVSYELVVPAETRLLSKTGSGSQDVSGVAGPAEVTTGSGNVRLADIAGEVRAHTGSGGISMTNLHGSVRAHTGSGHIHGEHLGFGGSVETRAKYEGKNLPLAPGERASNSFSDSSAAGGSNLDLQTGSGGIRVDDIRGRVRARTGSGTIELQGQPTGDWNMTTGSGGITVRLPAQAAFDLNAHTSSGSIHTDRQVTVQGTVGRHDLRGTVNGGGFHLDLNTGSGSIRIE
jgi:DUF4097 and DUF4098 domain-containing protein YvlB